METLVNSFSLLNESPKTLGQIRILQDASEPVKTRQAEAGKLYHTVTGETFASIDVLIFAVKQEFRVWRKDGKLSKYPEYSSYNMRTLVHYDTETGEKLGEKPLLESTQWQNRKGNKEARTEYVFIAALINNPQLVTIKISGLGYKYGRKFINGVIARQRELHDFVTRISVGSEHSSYGRKFVPLFEVTNLPVPDEWTSEKRAAICRGFVEENQVRLLAPALVA